MTPFLAHQQHIAERRQQPVRHRVFGQQTEPGGNPDRDPPRPAARLARADEGVERRRPARQQDRVGRDQKRRQRYAGEGRVNERRPEAGASVVEARRGGVDKTGRDRVQQRRR